jgi:hypothetical protein
VSDCIDDTHRCGAPPNIGRAGASQAGGGVAYLAATNIVTTLARSGGAFLEELKMPDFGSGSRRNRNPILAPMIDKLSALKIHLLPRFR